MKAVILMVAAALAADSVFPATPMEPLRPARPAEVRAATSKSPVKTVKKTKKRRFASLLAGSAGFVVSSAFNGGMEDR